MEWDKKASLPEAPHSFLWHLLPQPASRRTQIKPERLVPLLVAGCWFSFSLGSALNIDIERGAKPKKKDKDRKPSPVVCFLD